MTIHRAGISINYAAEVKWKNLEDRISECRATPNALNILEQYFSMTDIDCVKYNFTIGAMGSVFDNYKATLKLSRDYRKLIIHCYKPVEDKEAVERRIRKNR